MGYNTKFSGVFMINKSETKGSDPSVYVLLYKLVFVRG